MTTTKLGQILPVIIGGGRYKIPEVKGFCQVGGVQFKVINVPWIKTTDTNDIEGMIGQAVKTIVEGLTYQDLPLLDSVVIGDAKPKGLSTALIEVAEPGNNFRKSAGGGSILSDVTGFVTFVFKEDLSDAKVRRRKATGYFKDYMLSNPVLEVDI